MLQAHKGLVDADDISKQLLLLLQQPACDSHNNEIVTIRARHLAVYMYQQGNTSAGVAVSLTGWPRPDPLP